MSHAQNIQAKIATAASRSVSHSWDQNMSTSPTATFHSPTSWAGNVPHRAAPKALKPFNTQDIKILLLENVNEAGQDILRGQGYQVEALKTSLPEAELIEKIRDVHVIGIRSKTKLTERVLSEAKNLLVVGCFCIGTNQVDLDFAARHGIAVFNSPFANSRSVAELVIAEVILLARQIGDRSNELHRGTWNKVSAKCWEIRGKTLGIVGYGHIGSQLSVLAEAMGMTVIYYDVVTLMSLGTAKQVPTLEALLEEADFVTLHVPDLPETRNLMSTAQFSHMKTGSYLINASRGSVVDIPALIKAMRSGRVGGAAIDVYPNEPAANGDYFNNDLNVWGEDLRSLSNLILTPHIGGSTEEAQRAIGVEVSDALVRYINQGITLGSVNLPEIQMRSLTLDESDHARVIYIHRNVPGVLRKVNEILGDHNVDKQISDSRGDVAYLMADVSNVRYEQIKDISESLEALSWSLRFQQKRLDGGVDSEEARPWHAMAIKGVPLQTTGRLVHANLEIPNYEQIGIYLACVLCQPRPPIRTLISAPQRLLRASDPFESRASISTSTSTSTSTFHPPRPSSTPFQLQLSIDLTAAAVGLSRLHPPGRAAPGRSRMPSTAHPQPTTPFRPAPAAQL
ncbi:hypothetical protein G7046_g1556 [Stylonectria norvegica]|nr:hypothetical protein G7046_g1556 [Stylonectria norvegica]